MDSYTLSLDGRPSRERRGATRSSFSDDDRSVVSNESYECSVGGYSTVSGASGASGDGGRRVRFARKAKAKKTIHYKNMSKQELEATWYDQAGLDEIQVEIHLTLKKHYDNKAQEESSKESESKEEEKTEIKPVPQEDDIDGFEDYVDGDEDEIDDCIRGLENKGQLTNRLKQQEARNAVMKEQAWQKRHSVKDPSRIANIYKRISKTSIREAYTRAAGDKKFAQDIYKEDTEECASKKLGSMTAAASRSKQLLERRRQRMRNQVANSVNAAIRQ